MEDSAAFEPFIPSYKVVRNYLKNCLKDFIENNSTDHSKIKVSDIIQYPDFKKLDLLLSEILLSDFDGEDWDDISTQLPMVKTKVRVLGTLLKKFK